MKSWKWLSALAAPAMAATFLLPAVPAAASSTPCVDAPGNSNCNGASPEQADAAGKICWDSNAYPVPKGHPDRRSYTDPQTGFSYVISLWYSPTCGTNWARVDASGSGAFAIHATFSAKVRRYPGGGDGGYLIERQDPPPTLSQGQSLSVVSPMVYSPDNLAQACLRLPPFTGTPDQISCTAEH